ncbi:MAG: Uncharacterized protein Greene101449_1255 [Candidatus Peregrinibacteria bacterium Greene1014_49]|nr:MAG: Uncharacterized protein Greene101449_1255 [Candidatus Peregrinibacteria bacterium Greene1014_49]
MPSQTKILSATAGFLLLLVCVGHGEWLLIPHAWAQDKVVTDTQGGIMGTLLFGVTILNFLAFFLLKLCSYLVDPDFIFGVSNGEGSTQMMLKLWRISRDIMNLIFAILLLMGAIITIVLGKQEVLKQHLVKFILAVVLVNFSWFFPRVIIDIANVTTATIYGFPNVVGSKCKWIDKNGIAQPCVVVTDILYFEHAKTGTCPSPPIPWAPIAPLEMGSIMKVCLAPLIAGTNNGFGIINGLVANHGRLMSLGIIAGSPPAGGAGGTIAETLRFMIILTMVTFLNVMLTFPLAALTVAMIIRIPILWLTISFMPFMFIGFIIGEKFIKVNTMNIFTKHFMTAAFLPALVAIPFAIGYIMLNEVAELTRTGALVPPAGLAGNVDFFPEAQNWWQVIWILMAFAIIWMGSKMAMKGDEIYSKFTDPIYQVGSNFLKLPLTVPFIPTGTNPDGTKKFQSVSDVTGNLRSPTGLATQLGLRKPFDSGGGAAGSANNSAVLGALKNVDGGNAAAHEVHLLDEHIRKRGYKTDDKASVKQFLVELRATGKPDAQFNNIDDLADKIVRASAAKPAPTPPPTPPTPPPTPPPPTTPRP